MKRLLVTVLVLGVIVTVLDPRNADSSPMSPQPIEKELRLVVDASTDATLSARAYSVIDIETGEVLLSHNADVLLPIASVTKLFTAAAVLEDTIKAPLTITVADIETEGRAGKLAVGEQYTPEELLFPLLLESSNDAAAALERVHGPIELAGRTLPDAAGLSPENQASATELARELRKLYHTEPRIFDITKLSQHIGTYTGWVNNSPVHDFPGYRGGKHGYTEAAGKTLAAVFAEPAIENRELGYVLLGSTDIAADTSLLRKVVERSVSVE